MIRRLKKILLIGSIAIPLFALSQNNIASRIIKADLEQTRGEHSKMYAECIGAGRANEGLRADWQEQLRFIKKEIDFKYIRFHGLLNDEMHVYTEDKEGRQSYNFQYIDKLYDFLLGIHIRPFVELSFMPPDLASGTKTVFWWKGNVTPPKDNEKWSRLITALVKHFEDRYGRAEVEHWYFEVWNEPDLGGFFSGTQEQYFQLYSITAAAIKSVSNSYKVGGPATARNFWITPFLHYCAEHNVPLDFISTHSYNTKSVLDEFGLGKRRLLTENYLPDAVKKVRRMIDSTIFKNKELHYTEFNSSPSSHDPLHDTYQNAAWLLSTLKKTEGYASSMSYWTFTDIFEETGPAMTPFHGGFGLLNLQGIRKPSFYAYKFLSELGEAELINHDSCSWICKNKTGVQILLWNLHLPFNDTTVYDEVYFRKIIPAKDAENVSIQLDHVPDGKYRMIVYQTGYHNNDPYTAYMEMGTPFNISLLQEVTLKKNSSGAEMSNKLITIKAGRFSDHFIMKENELCFIKLIRI